MARKLPKEEEEFLAQHPLWVRKVLQGDFELAPDELADMMNCKFPEVIGQAQDKYVELLRRFPERLREYRNQQKRLGAQSALLRLPTVAAGRPRQDALAQEARDLKETGLSQSAIARELNRRHPHRRDQKGNPSPITAEAVRKMLARQHGKAPDKT